MLNTMKRLVVGAAMIGALAACSSNVRTTALVAEATPTSLVQSDSPIHQNISIGQVTGGQETASIGLTKVSNSEFRKALQDSMLLANALGGKDANLTVDAQLEKLDQPQLAVNLEVTSIIFYRVRSVNTGAIVFQERITTPFKTKFTESLVRSERQRLANEGSIKANIQSFLEKLNTSAKAEPYRFL